MDALKPSLLIPLSALAALAAAPAAAAATLETKAETRALMSLSPAAASGEVRPLPLPPSRAARERAQVPGSAIAALASRGRPVRVLVGAASHAAVQPLVAVLRRHGARPRVLDPIAVIAATAPAGLVKALRADPRVAYVERDARLRLAGDGDFLDPEHGINFSWAWDSVDAGGALAAAGGGSRRTVAIIDTGLDVSHPDLAGRIGRRFDALTGTQVVTDAVGHGTFVAGLIAMVDGNGGGKGVAGNTTVLPIRASIDGSFTLEDVLQGIAFSIRRGADVLNLSLAGDSFDASQARAFDLAFFNDVLPVAASGNRALEGNPVEFPAAFLGGRRGTPGIGLSVGATLPNDQPADFSNHNNFVSLAAPGASPDCRRGVWSTVPANPNAIWDDDRGGCFTPVSIASGGARWGYGQGTSFSAPLASGIAALTWQVEPDLQSEQVAEVMIRSARQTVGGPGWNEFTGRGIVDGGDAGAIAQIYDTDAPRIRASARRRGARVLIRIRSSGDRTDPGHELAGNVRYTAAVTTDGGRSFRTIRRSRRPIRVRMRFRSRRPHQVVGLACDGNGNCGVKRLGRFRP